jgi:hypothetical protein
VARKVVRWQIVMRQYVSGVEGREVASSGAARSFLRLCCEVASCGASRCVWTGRL